MAYAYRRGVWRNRPVYLVCYRHRPVRSLRQRLAALAASARQSQGQGREFYRQGGYACRKPVGNRRGVGAAAAVLPLAGNGLSRRVDAVPVGRFAAATGETLCAACDERLYEAMAATAFDDKPTETDREKRLGVNQMMRDIASLPLS